MRKPAPQPQDVAPNPGGPALQGEGNYTATRRHRASVKKFIDAGKVEPAAEDAAPDSSAEAQELEAAERAGREHARR
jgi:hypothetical protein